MRKVWIDTKRIRIAIFPDRFTMIIIHQPDGKELNFSNYDQAQRFINANRLPANVSPVEITEDPATDPMHISHAISEVMARLQKGMS